MSTWLSQLLFQLRFHPLAVRLAVNLSSQLSYPVHHLSTSYLVLLFLRVLCPSLRAWLTWYFFAAFFGFAAFWGFCLPLPCAPLPACACLRLRLRLPCAMVRHILRATFGCSWLLCLQLVALHAYATSLRMSRSLSVSTRTVALGKL